MTPAAGMPAEMRLALPYNHRLELLDAVTPIADRVCCLYLPFHPTVALSARSFLGAAAPARYAAQLAAVAARCARLGIGMNLVANAPAWAVRPAAIVATLERLRDTGAELRATFADLLAAREVRRRAPWVAIGVSCLADVRSPDEARHWREQVGASVLTVSREINRRPAALAALAGSGMRLAVVSTDDCVPGCQAAGRHYRPSAGRGGRGRGCGTFDGACDPGSLAVRRGRAWMLAQKEILPGHLRHLAGLVAEVKVTGRDASTEEVLRRTRLYLEAESLTHPNGHYREPPNGWDVIARCDRLCERCGWCPAHLTAAATAPTAPGVRIRVGGGGILRVWLAPPDPRRPAPVCVQGQALYYSVEQPVSPAVVGPLIARVAGALAASGVPVAPDGLADALVRSRVVRQAEGEPPGLLELSAARRRAGRASRPVLSS